jgi:hypothetical protein
MPRAREIVILRAFALERDVLRREVRSSRWRAWGRFPEVCVSESHRLERRLTELVDRAAALDLARFEDAPTEELLHTFRAGVAGLLDEALRIADAIYGAFDGSMPERPIAEGEHFLHRIDRLVFSTEDRRARIASIAELSSAELRRSRERVLGLSSALAPWEIVAQCASAARRIRKVCEALRRVIGEVAYGTRYPFRTELAIGLTARRRYAVLRRSIRSLGEVALPTAASIRIAEQALDNLVKDEVYRDLRLQDRLQARSLARRTNEWLRGGTLADEQEGVRLLLDLSQFASSIGRISRRRDIVKHDVAILDQLSDELERLRGDTVEEDLFMLLDKLEGLDPEADTLLQESIRDAARWRSVVTRLLAASAMLASWLGSESVTASAEAGR